MKIQFHRIDTNVVVGLLVREFCCSGTDVSAKVLAMYADTRTPSMEPQWLAAGLSQFSICNTDMLCEIAYSLRNVLQGFVCKFFKSPHLSNYSLSTNSPCVSFLFASCSLIFLDMLLYPAFLLS